MTRRRTTETGSMLVVVLWWLVILTILSVAVHIAVRPRLRFAGRIRDRAVSNSRATAVLQLAQAVLAEGDHPGYDALNQAWSSNPDLFADVVLGGSRFSVGYRMIPSGRREAVYRYGLTDEERKINVNRADREVLVELLNQVAGIGELEATPIVSSIINWRDRSEDSEKYGAGSTYYRSLSPPYPCKNDLFELSEELLLVRGVTAALYSALEPHITVYGNGAVNLNTAGRTVLRSLGLADPLIDKVVQCRYGPDGIPGTEDDVPFETVAGIVDTVRQEVGLSETEARELSQFIRRQRITVRSNNFRGQVYETLDNSTEGVHITFVLNRTGVVRLWREF